MGGYEMNDVGLLCVTHDKEGKNLKLIESYAKQLKKFYSGLYITVSEETDPRIIDCLINNEFKVKVIPKKGAAHARREVVKFGLTSEHLYFHYADFDRILTWVKLYPDELENIVNQLTKYDYLILGRTEEAFQSHPVEWRKTEEISNRITSLELNLDVDVTAGSCAFSRESADLLIKYSQDKMTDSEWPMIIKRIGMLNVSYQSVNGLVYLDEINDNGRKLSDSEKWFSRLKLSYIISESAIKIGKE